MTVLLEVRDLSVNTTAPPFKEVVRSVSFQVRPGETTCIVGASGSGKSLSCLAVPGLLPPGVQRKSGQIFFQGKDLHSAAPSELRALRGSTMAMVMQNPMSCFDPLFTVESHFRETLRAHGVREKKIMDEKIEGALREAGFDDSSPIRRAYPFQLSGGMLQRVMLALSLILDPLLLIADEPTSDLDTVAQAGILDLMDAARKRRGMGILLVTHDFAVVARMADRVVVMDEGAVVEAVEASRIFAAPEHPVTQRLLEAHKRLGEGISWEEGRR